MPDGQRIVGDEALREHPLITFPSLYGFREVVGEVCANQLFARRPGNLDSSFGYVGHLSLLPSRYHLVYPLFVQAPCILRRLLLGADIARGGEYTQHVASCVLVSGGVVQHFRLPFFFNDTATTEIYTLSLHDALPISFPSLYGFREVVGEVCANQLFARRPGDFHRGL